MKFLDRLKAKSAGRQAPAELMERAESLRRAGKLSEAIELYDAVIREHPDHAEAYYKRANAHNGLRRWEAALTDYDRAIALEPDHARAFCNRGAVLQGLRRWEDALASLDRALAVDPRDAFSHNNRGSALRELRRWDEACASFERAIALNPGHVEAHINLANVLRELDRHELAIASYDKAIGIGGVHAEAFHGRGLSLVRLRRFEEALASHDQAIALNGGNAAAHLSRAHVLRELKRHEPAVESYTRAIALEPGHAEAFEGRGFCLNSIGLIEEAISDYDRALALEPNRMYVLGMRIHAQMHICAWDDLAPNLQRLVERVQARQPAIKPFALAALVDSPHLQRLAAEMWVREQCPPDDSLGEIMRRGPGGKIRVGYFSADFRAHPVSLLTAELFETHNRSRFEIMAFAFGPDSNDPIRRRLVGAFDRFIDVHDRSDAEVASLARELGIDIAVDLGGFTVHARTRIFALRAAPIQLSYIGYLGTMAAPYIDYLVADPTLVPPGARQHYSEKIIYLPAYQANDSQRRIAEHRFTRQELGLPVQGFVFSCCNANYKITPSTFETWMRILSRVPGSALFLYADNPMAQDNLRRQAELHGVEGWRIVFGERIPDEYYLARMRTMDLFLDTLPYNAGTTASDALRVGVPVLTCLGQAFASRMAASVLQAIGLPELIADTRAQYEDLAVRLAMNPDEMARIRQKLAHNRTEAALFDTARFTRNLERAYVHILERYRAQLPPEHVHLPS